MKPLISSVLILLAALTIQAQDFRLSDRARISIITFGPSQSELYSAFGHTAIRVIDPEMNIDYAYNYGVFDFDQPNFYLNFARGSSFYILGVNDYPDMREAYIYYKRFVHEQVLNLTTEQKQKVVEFLEWNAKPENRSYRYDYFYDNCATRVRDVFKKVLKSDITFDSTYIKTNYSIRDLTDLYLEHQPWGDLGIDICLGLPMDKKASPYEYMFLPDYIESSFDHATITIDGQKQPLVKSKLAVYEPPAETFTFQTLQPWTIFGLFLIITIIVSYRDWKRKKRTPLFDGIVFTSVGLIGVLLLLLWTATDHKAAATNFNLLWALPTHFIAGIILFRKNLPAWMRKYFLTVAALLTFTLLGWNVLPQHLNLFLIPFVTALLLRSFVIYTTVSPNIRQQP